MGWAGLASSPSKVGWIADTWNVPGARWSNSHGTATTTVTTQAAAAGRNSKRTARSQAVSTSTSATTRLFAQYAPRPSRTWCRHARAGDPCDFVGDRPCFSLVAAGRRRLATAWSTQVGHHGDHGNAKAVADRFSEREYRRVRQLAEEHVANYPRRIATYPLAAAQTLIATGRWFLRTVITWVSSRPRGLSLSSW
jgi:hypothetical protein